MINDKTQKLTTDRKKDLLLQMAKGKRPNSSKIGARLNSSRAPLALVQRKLWVMYKLDPARIDYNQVAALELSGPLNLNALKGAFQEIINRHEAIRTCFIEEENDVFQKIMPPFQINLPITDLRHLSANEVMAEVEAKAKKLGSLPFDLSNLPLFKVEVIISRDDKTILIVSIHHIIADEWSLIILIKELNRLYSSICYDTEIQLPPLTIQYGDFAEWQNLQFENGVFDKQLDYWYENFSGDLPTLEIPEDFTRTVDSPSQGEEVKFQLDEITSAAVLELSNKHQATPFMITLAMIFGWLHKLSGQNDLIIGCPIANRSKKELECLIGYFANTIAYRCNITAETSFSDLIIQTREAVLNSYDNQDVPFDMLISKLKPPRLVGRTPVFQVLLNFENIWSALDEQREQDVIRPIQIPLSGTKFDLSLYIAQSPNEPMWGVLQYASDIFQKNFGRGMMKTFTNFSNTLVQNSSTPIYQLPVAGTEEEKAIIKSGTGPKIVYDAPQLLHQLILQQASLTPDAIACQFAGSQLTYKNLVEKAKSVSHNIQRLGIEEGAIIGVTLDRSLELLPILIGTMMAGCSYAPLDASLPIQLLTRMIEDSGIEYLIIDEAHQNDLTTLPSIYFLPDDLLAQANNTNQDCPSIRAEYSANLAYVIFTSGSTGIPKACMITHEAICNRINWMQSTFQLKNTDRVLQKTQTAFDVSVWELFWGLTSGATVVLAKPEGQKDPSYLRDLITTESITTAHFVPSMLRPFMEFCADELPTSLKRVICSGEVLSKSDAMRFSSLLPEVKLYNLYGPTEAAVDVSSWLWRDDFSASRLPIGKPISNVFMAVLDNELHPLPPGIEGDLYIGGIALARGYCNDPQKTAERFVPSPFDHGKRIYRTGDRARSLGNGEIDYLGRSDHQIKLRGYRIELGQIDSALMEQPGIEQAVTLLREDIPGGKQLVAYYTVNASSTEKPGQPSDQVKDEFLEKLEKDLKRSLPPYMIPSTFMAIESFPQTTTGKLDRKALPAPKRNLQSGPIVAPRNQLEQTLLDSWKSVLHIDTISIHDNFFQVGGDSIRGITLIAQAKKAGVIITIKQLFQHQTIANLAEHVISLENSSNSENSFLAGNENYESISDEDLIGINSTDLKKLQEKYPFAEEILPLSATPSDMLFQMQSSDRKELNLVQVLTISPVDPSIIAQAYETLAVNNPVLRSTYVWDELGGPLQIVHPKGEVPHVFEDWRHLTDEEQRTQAEKVLHADSLRGPDLDRPSATRIFSARISDDSFMIIQSFNYMCLDGWSMLILGQEAGYLMQSGLTYKPNSNRPPYRRYLAWRSQQNIDEAEIFWKRELKGWKPALLAQMIGRPDIVSDKIMLKTGLYLKGKMSESIRDLTNKNGYTENLFYLTAWVVLLSHILRQKDITLGVVVNGRTPEVNDISEMVGHTMNYLPFRVQIEHGDTITTLLKRVREKSIDLLSYQTVSQQEIQTWSESDSNEHFFDSLFYFQNLASYFTSDYSQLLDFKQPLSLTRTAFPLRIDIYPTVSEIGNQIAAGYDSSVFSLNSMKLLLRNYSEVLFSMITRPNITIIELMEIIQTTEECSGFTAPIQFDETCERLW